MPLPSLAIIASAQIVAPSPVAARRPAVPPSTIGLPVTTPGEGWPTCWE